MLMLLVWWRLESMVLVSRRLVVDRLLWSLWVVLRILCSTRIWWYVYAYAARLVALGIYGPCQSSFVGR